MHAEAPPETLLPSPAVDSDHPAVRAFAEDIARALTPREAAVALFYAVRDGWRYNPWNVSLDPADYRASVVLARDPREGHCIDKATLLAAACRAIGLPARLHYADVRNHIGTARLEQQLGTDRLVYHGYTEIWLDGRWVAATPAFNAGLCARLGVAPLEWDGRSDAIFQAFDREPGGFMEYLADHGTFIDPPVAQMVAAWKHYYQLPDGGWPRPGAQDA
jgi:transglutaminase-like putative cysteine protease